MNRAGTIVIGHNDGWKQKTVLSKKVAQKFEAIPHSRFIFILKDKAERYGINVVIVEESYTSKASLLDMDSIPVYGVRDTAGLYYFSGRRVKRGVYEASGGRKINADINGAGNIIRKYDPFAMELNLDYLVQTVKIINVA
ncbi:MAG: IS200/IS605 family accessory protein TnpB-related protein [Lachnospiraceae bacterium]|nr:IS200/IS605 family accessory protein TnpB-related protein [Lachnospiraceae bacterium]